MKSSIFTLAVLFCCFSEAAERPRNTDALAAPEDDLPCELKRDSDGVCFNEDFPRIPKKITFSLYDKHIKMQIQLQTTIELTCTSINYVIIFKF